MLRAAECARASERQIDLSIDSTPHGSHIRRLACTSPMDRGPASRPRDASSVTFPIRTRCAVEDRYSTGPARRARGTRVASCAAMPSTTRRSCSTTALPRATHNTATGPRCAGGSAWQNRESCGHGEFGRCTRSDSSLLIEPLARRITEHRCSRPPIFDSWRRVAPGTQALGALFIHPELLRRAPSGWQVPNALTDRPRRSERAHAGDR